MKPICTALAAFLVCFLIPTDADGKSHLLTRDRAIQIATANVQKLKLPLPADYQVSVENGRSYFEGQNTRETYVVIFSIPYSARKRRVIYMVDVDKVSKKVSSFTDYRKMVNLIP
jgi:hypothetical protein